MPTGSLAVRSNPPSGGADAFYVSSALTGKNCSYIQDTKLGLEVKNYFAFSSGRKDVVYNIDCAARRGFIYHVYKIPKPTGGAAKWASFARLLHP